MKTNSQNISKILKKFYLIIFIINLHLISTVKTCSFHDTNKNSDINYEQKRRIEKSVDHTIEPCEDFYAYACNNYQNAYKNEQYEEITGFVEYEMNKKLMNHLQEGYFTFKKNPKYIEDIQKYYKSCVWEKKRNLKKYLEEIKPSNGLNWPILEDVDKLTNNNAGSLLKFAFNILKKLNKPDLLNNATLYEWPPEANFDYLDLLGNLQTYGLNNVLIYQEIIQNENGSFEVIIEPAYFEYNNASLPQETIIQVLLENLGLKSEKLLKYIQQLQLTDQTWLERIQNFTQTDNVEEINIENLSSKYKKLNLTSFIYQLVPENSLNDVNIVIKNPEFFQYLNDKKWQNLVQQHLCNYIMFRFLYYLAKDSTNEFTSYACINDLRNKMDLAVNYVYYTEFFQSEEIRYTNEINTMVKEIKNTIKQFFQDNQLNLSPPQLQKLEEKLLNIKVNIGNLPTDHSPQYIEDFYKDIPSLDKRNYYKNHLYLLKHRFSKSLFYSQNQTYFLTSDNQFGSSSVPVYVPSQNMVVIPLGSLQYPMFHYNYQMLYKWSLMGFVLAHEFVHAFDTTGLNYDSNGLPLSSNSDILDNQSFIKSLECMENQLSTEAVDERIADLFAVRIVYRIFEKLNQNSDLSPEFFLNLSQFFCDKKNINFVDHDADSLRLQQIVMNFKEFSRVYQCPENSTMNPMVKCQLY